MHSHLYRIRSLDGALCRDAIDVVLLVLARCVLRAVATLHATRPSTIDAIHAELLGRLLPLERATSE